MARITLIAARSKGGTPTATREATVERDGNNVFLSMPQETEGVISGASAVAFAQAILTAAGSTTPSGSTAAASNLASSIPTGWSLRSHDGGYVIEDAAGVVRGTFKPVTKYVAG